MTEHRLYTDRAELYDAIYAAKPYAAEAERLHGLLAGLGLRDGSRVLEAACGTGSYLQHLQRWYEVSGFDANEAMLAIARRKVPGVPLFLGDLVDFTVERPFDALVCLFSSFGYLHTEPAIDVALSRFGAALRPGGVLVIEPFVAPAAYQEGSTHLQTYEGERLKCARASVSLRHGELAIIEFGWLVVREGSPEVEQFRETHALLLCEPEALRRRVVAAGFELATADVGLVRGRPVVVATKRG